MEAFYCPSCHHEFLMDELPDDKHIRCNDCGEVIRTPLGNPEEERLLTEFYSEWMMEPWKAGA